MTEPSIVARGLTKHFGNLCAVDNLDLEIRRGETLGLLGPNGAGKSTTINLMLGLSRPSTGSVRIFGHPPQARQARRVTGYVAQESDFPPNLTVVEILDLVRSHYPDPVPRDDLIGHFALESLADRQVGGFSGGQRRKLALALAFAGRGRIVFLDEPTTGLDRDARRGFWGFARNFIGTGGTLLLTTHQLQEVEAVADRVCLIDQGRIRLEGTVGEIRRQVSQKQVRFACQDLPELEPVSRIQHDDGVVTVTTPDADALVRRLVEFGVAFSDLEIRSATLEEAVEQLSENTAGEIR